MKKTMKYFSMAALALVGAVMTSCSSDDLTENTQQRAENNGNNIETLTVNISMAGDETRALDANGHKTFAVGDKIAVVYMNKSGEKVKAETEALTSSDIISEGTEANFTVTLTNPNKEQDVTYIYPASMVNADGSIKNDVLDEQDGTLDNLAKDLDYCEFTHAWIGSDLPSGYLDNKLVICAFTIKTDGSGSTDITNTITNMTVTDGTYTYNVNRAAAAGPIYVAIHPVSTKNINYTATDGTKFYVKFVKTKTYVAGNWYKLGLRMADVISGKFTVNASGKQVYFSKGNLRANYTGSAWAWGFAPNQWSIVGSNSANINITGNGTVNVGGYLYVDLFGWSTSATHLGIHNSTNNNDYRGADFADWGSASEVTNYIGTGWCTLSGAEWSYLFGVDPSNRRNTTSGYYYCKAFVNDIPGVILLPDDWEKTFHTLNKPDVANLSFNKGSGIDIISLEDWNSDFVPHGAVFLPTTGQREGITVTNENGRLYYWSSTSGATTSGDGANANYLYIAGNVVSPNQGAGRHYASAVRLVYPME